MKTSSTRTGMRTAMWMCAVLMAAIAVALPLRYGVSWWTVLLAVVLLACPVAVGWTAVRFGRRDSFPPISPDERRKP